MAKTTAERDLLLEEYELERDSIDIGIEKYRKSVRKAVASGSESTTRYGNNIVNSTVNVVSEGIIDHIESSYLGIPGHLAASSKLLIQLDPDISAFMGLKVVVDNLSTPMGMTNVAIKVGQHIEDEVRFLKFKKENPSGFKKVKDEVVERTTNRNNRRIAINYTMKFKYGVEHLPWSKQESYQVGMTLIHIITEKTGLVRQAKVGWGKGKTKINLQATDETIWWLEKANSKSEMLNPVFQPMIHPPKRWTSLFNGGYWLSELRLNKLIKASNHCYIEELEHDEMPLVYSTTNALGATSWRVDEDILKVVKVAWEQGWQNAGLPSKDQIEIPPSPFAHMDIKKKDMTPDQKLQLRQWSVSAARIHNLNAKSMSKKLRLIRTIQTADKFMGRGIYFPHSRCFRGRLYPTPSFLSYQSESYAKALLRFNTKLPIETKEQADALKKHGANCIGYDKYTLEDRLNAIDNMNDEVIAWATDPFEHRGWLDVDSPWESLQFAYEWKGFTEQGYGYLSDLCVSVDGSINGSQHCSAMLRDPVGAKATNLYPNKTPSDLYNILSEDVRSSLSEKDDDIARDWVNSDLLTRKLVKRPVMTRAYSSTKQSCRQYLEDYVIEQRAIGNESWDVRKDFRHTMYACDALWLEMAERLKGQTLFMEWLKDIVEIYAENNIPFTWKAPNGFIVFQRYTQMTKTRVKTTIDGEFYRGLLHLPNEKKSCKRRNKQGCAPNVIHSMDAAHLDLTANAMLDKYPGMSFGMVHDSFGCHAARMPEMLTAIKETFVKMYQENNIIHQIYDDCCDLFGDVTPQPPELGDFDITKVLESDYFFS